MGNRMQCRIHQVRSIHKDMQAGSFGKGFIIQFVDRLMHSFQHLRRILSAKHLDDTFHSIGIITDTVVESQYPFTFQATIFQGSQIIQVDRYTVLGLDNDTSQIIQVFLPVRYRESHNSGRHGLTYRRRHSHYSFLSSR